MPKLNDLATMDAINALLDTYQGTLTKRQAQMMSLYFRYNLSLQEIAKELHITRAAVSIAIKDATVSLNMLETHIGMVALKTKLLTIMDDPATSVVIRKKIRALLNREE